LKTNFGCSSVLGKFYTHPGLQGSYVDWTVHMKQNRGAETHAKRVPRT